MQLRFHREMFIIFISFEKIYRRTDQNWQLNKTDTRHTYTHHKSERERKEGVSIPLNLMVSVSKAILNVIQSLGSISREITQDLSSFFFLIGSLRVHTHISIASSNIDDSRVLNRRRHKFTHSIQNTQCDATACISLN